MPHTLKTVRVFIAAPSATYMLKKPHPAGKLLRLEPLNL